MMDPDLQAPRRSSLGRPAVQSYPEDSDQGSAGEAVSNQWKPSNPAGPGALDYESSWQHPSPPSMFNTGSTLTHPQLADSQETSTLYPMPRLRWSSTPGIAEAASGATGLPACPVQADMDPLPMPWSEDKSRRHRLGAPRKAHGKLGQSQPLKAGRHSMKQSSALPTTDAAFSSLVVQAASLSGLPMDHLTLGRRVATRFLSLQSAARRAQGQCRSILGVQIDEYYGRILQD
ncbi:hypothetical protein NDU88_007040 [Pleurodeles waltl]|uniref:Uncharacterized protein n=1 Tax=Pleurodeles waltl TaxID=8319 RepID=A0AAV7U0A9_PLEWA|nr:hypothetical protein NDU88_007040 [Pleurodeles waltl]